MRLGALGAMMDEYERVSKELIAVLQAVSDVAYTKEHPEQLEDCRSIQIIMRHVCGAAYVYANTIRKTFGIAITKENPGLASKEDTIRTLHDSLAYTEESLSGKWSMTDDEIDETSMVSNWGVVYNLEQMLEHAIVHIMRHRRQIERLLHITSVA